MQHRTISQLCNDWIGHMRRCDQSAKRAAEEIRLTHDQAMRLCFEISKDSYNNLTEYAQNDFGGAKQLRAMAAYQAGRPWDFLAGSHLFGQLVPYEPRVYPPLVQWHTSVPEPKRVQRPVYEPVLMHDAELWIS